MNSFLLRGCRGIHSNLIPPGNPRYSGGDVDNATLLWDSSRTDTSRGQQNKLSINGHRDNNYSWIFPRALTLHPCVDGRWIKGLSQPNKTFPLSPLLASWILTSLHQAAERWPLGVRGGGMCVLTEPKGRQGRRRFTDVAATKGVIHYPGLMKT